MKTILRNHLLSVCTFGMGVSGAFLGQIESEGRPLVLGYEVGSPQGTVCINPKTCQTEVSPWLCRVIDGDPATPQVFGVYQGRCILTVYRAEL